MKEYTEEQKAFNDDAWMLARMYPEKGTLCHFERLVHNKCISVAERAEYFRKFCAPAGATRQTIQGYIDELKTLIFVRSTPKTKQDDTNI